MRRVSSALFKKDAWVPEEWSKRGKGRARAKLQYCCICLLQKC